MTHALTAAERQSFQQVSKDRNVSPFIRQTARIRVLREKEQNLQLRGIQTIHNNH